MHMIDLPGGIRIREGDYVIARHGLAKFVSQHGEEQIAVLYPHAERPKFEFPYNVLKLARLPQVEQMEHLLSFYKEQDRRLWQNIWEAAMAFHLQNEDGVSGGPRLSACFDHGFRTHVNRQWNLPHMMNDYLGRFFTYDF